jgi:hypothetical protein
VLDLSQLQPEDVSVRMKAARELRGLSQSALGLLFEEDGLGKTDPGRIERMDPKVPFRRGPHCCPRPRSLQRSGTVYEIPSSPTPVTGRVQRITPRGRPALEGWSNLRRASDGTFSNTCSCPQFATKRCASLIAHTI